MQADPTESIATVVSRSERRSNYVLRHWRGANSLGFAFWVNGVLVNIAAGLMSFGLASPTIAYVFYNPFVALPLSIGLVVGLTGLMVWQVVGIWRSSFWHRSRGGNRLWAVLASLMAILWCISGVKEIVDTGIPTASMLLEYAQNLGTDRRTVSVLAGGKEVELAGLISYGAASEVREALDDTGATVLRLNSEGGRFGEAMKLLKLVRERSLITYSSRGCNSACTIVFLGGRERWLSSAARLGFHRFSGVPEGSALEPMAEDQFRNAYEDLGLSTAFIERMFATPANDMWNPEIDELLSASLVTGIAQYGQFAESANSVGVYGVAAP